MKFALMVTAPPDRPGALNALGFARAALAGGHELVRVFFYGDGVGNANRLIHLPPGEPQTVQAWTELAAAHGLDLVVCSTAGRRRGLREATIAPGFRISGLGQLVEAGRMADRLLCFGA